MSYQAGVCNIGSAEISHRKGTFGWGGAVISLALFTILSFLDLSLPYYLLLAIPIYTSVIGFIQANEKFCVYYGLNGVRNMSENIGETDDVIGQINRKKDRTKAISIRQKAFIITLSLTVLLGGVGHLL